MNDRNKIKYNLIIGIGGQVIALILGILVPKFVLDGFGSEINGLLTSVTNIYGYVALVEAGIAAAASQSLYKAIAASDRNEMNAIMAATHRYYLRTGWIYLALVLMFAGIYPLLVNTDLPYMMVMQVILFNGIGNVINYFFHGKYLILLKADGKNYVRVGLEIIINALKQISKIVLISMGYGIVTVQLVVMLTSFLQMIYITYYIRKKYSWIDLSVQPNQAALCQSKNVFVHEFNYLITYNIDAALLTFFSTLKIVSVHSLYTLLYGIVFKVSISIKDALEFKVANEYYKGCERFYKIFEVYEAGYMAFSFAMLTVVQYFATPFLQLYTQGVNDINYIDGYLPYLFTIVYALWVTKYPSEAMVYIAGHFRQTQHSAVMETSINVVVSFVLVHVCGIYGVLIGSIVSSLYRIGYLMFYVNKQITGRNPLRAYRSLAICTATYAVCIWLSRFIKLSLTSYLQIVALCVPYALCVCLMYLVAMAIAAPDGYIYVLSAFIKYKNKKKTN